MVLKIRICHFKEPIRNQLEELIYSQLENLNAMNDLISIVRHQNELLKNANKKLKEEITDFKERQMKCPTVRRRTA